MSLARAPLLLVRSFVPRKSVLAARRRGDDASREGVTRGLRRSPPPPPPETHSAAAAAAAISRDL